MVSAGRIRNSSSVYEPLSPPFCPRGENKAHYIIHAFVDNSSGCRPAPLAQRTPRFGVTNLALKLISDSGSSLGKPPVLPVSLPVRKALPSNDGMRDSLPRPGGRCAVFGAPGATVSGTASGDQSHGLSTRHAALFFLPSGSTDRASCWSGRLDSTRPREISPVPANAREIPLRLLPSDAVVGWQWIPANRLRTLFCRRDGAQEPTLEFYPACCLLNIYCTVALSDYVLIFIVRQQHVQCLDVFCITYRAISAYFADANCGK